MQIRDEKKNSANISSSISAGVFFFLTVATPRYATVSFVKAAQESGRSVITVERVIFAKRASTNSGLAMSARRKGVAIPVFCSGYLARWNSRRALTCVAHGTRLQSGGI